MHRIQQSLFGYIGALVPGSHGEPIGFLRAQDLRLPLCGLGLPLLQASVYGIYASKPTEG